MKTGIFALAIMGMLIAIGKTEDVNRNGQNLDEHIKEVADMGGLGGEMFDFDEKEFEGLSDDEKVIWNFV